MLEVSNLFIISGQVLVGVRKKQSRRVWIKIQECDTVSKWGKVTEKNHERTQRKVKTQVKWNARVTKVWTIKKIQNIRTLKWLWIT